MLPEVKKSELKTILHSKRANLYYLEKCRVMQKDGRIVYLTESDKENLYWNIPIANTTVLLLGTGTSVTQAAMRLLSAAGVLVGFCGGGGTPLFAGTDIQWFCPESEYRPTQYCQGWLSFWFDEKKRLTAAKEFQSARIGFLLNVWEKDKELHEELFYPDDEVVASVVAALRREITDADSVSRLLGAEAVFTKKLYQYAAGKTDVKDFVRDRDSGDCANNLLNYGNYLAYGLAATALWALGIPFSFAVMHGKTRRGALVFDVADLVKDAIVLPWSFIGALRNRADRKFRQLCLQKFTEHQALDFMFSEIEKCSALFSGGEPQ